MRYSGRIRHGPAEQVDKRFVRAYQFHWGGGCVVLVGGRNIEIRDCDLYGSSSCFHIGFARGALISGNTFYNGRWGYYDIYNSDGVIFEHNEIIGADLMSTGGGLSCWQTKLPYQQNIYFGHNTFRLFHGWDREAMTSDGGGGAYFGGISSAQGSSLVLADEPQWRNLNWAGAAVFILGGKGAGQYRRVVSHEGRRVEVDKEWDILPDSTSQVSITGLQRNYLMVGNNFSDCTIAVQFYGTSIHHIAAGNRCERAGGYHTIGQLYAGGYQPAWFVQFLDNEVVEGNGMVGPLNQFPPLDSHLAALGRPAPPFNGPMTRCVTMRRNRLRNNARIEVSGGCEDVIVEGNVVENTDYGIVIGDAGSGVLLHGNRFRNVKEPLLDHSKKALIRQRH